VGTVAAGLATATDMDTGWLDWVALVTFALVLAVNLGAALRRRGRSESRGDLVRTPDRLFQRTGMPGVADRDRPAAAELESPYEIIRR